MSPSDEARCFKCARRVSLAESMCLVADCAHKGDAATREAARKLESRRVEADALRDRRTRARRLSAPQRSADAFEAALNAKGRESAPPPTTK